MKYKHVVNAVLSEPWAIMPEKMDAILAFLHMKSNGKTIDATGLEPTAATRSEIKVTGGIQVVNVYDTIMPKGNALSEFSGGTSVQMLTQTLKEARVNDDVSQVILRGHTPGGSVFGIEECAGEINKLKAVKPVIAHADYMVASAGLWLLSQATEFIASPSAQVGSIGVIMHHMNYSEFMEKEGVESKYIYSGKYKSEGNPYEPLSEDAEAYMQYQCDQYYKQFVDAVAKGRGVTSKTVINDFGEGRMMMAKDAKAAGLVDRIESFDQTIARISKPTSRRRSNRARAQAMNF